ncbi:NERD domain-containing protein [Ruoffia tabacinasalis]|uniref:NERD domain-containing protein n=1 Tax=Ruoffia tabacinasalis TaxID=87458 RepID=A0A5R9DVB6_9LACT|nr:nuclease-related domain-containing protein [Ruoffia tabacinasalis]TLQ40696.1 NERD domain-containing protein [Ruoffia tabacinasalis]
MENYRTGFIGEGECLLMLLPEIPQNWEVLADLNFPLVAGRMQIDIMLISSRKGFHFEVKNLLQN